MRQKDTAVENRDREFSFNLKGRRIQYAPHAIDLAVHSMLYEVKRENLEEIIECWRHYLTEQAKKSDDAINKTIENECYDDIEWAIKAQGGRLTHRNYHSM
ncbi:hypothetical protein FHL15_005879 [Xylaria flabelliformis]|uniref:Uncharacterized protein n=1 Tax=Xylaria flabelliformis TaxID=2512241 RepID=A0A553HZC0_9PEZI|nr:hypothetical protein FHL15_005879 [Xylaria flabelliformis]